MPYDNEEPPNDLLTTGYCEVCEEKFKLYQLEDGICPECWAYEHGESEEDESEEDE